MIGIGILQRHARPFASPGTAERVDQFRLVLVITVPLWCGAAILLTGLLGFLTFRRIVKPIRALDESVRTIAAGDYAQAVPFTRATDETGGLARSVDILKHGAAAMDEQRWVKANVSRVTGALQAAASLAEFGRRHRLWLMAEHRGVFADSEIVVTYSVVV